MRCSSSASRSAPASARWRSRRSTRCRRFESLGQLTGGVAHDFNNVSDVDHGDLDLLLRQPADPRQAPHRRCRPPAQRGANLCPDARLCAAARAEARPSTSLPASTAFGHVAALARTDVSRSSRFQSGLPFIMVDPNQFELALFNLALNARDAMPDGGADDRGAPRVVNEADAADACSRRLCCVCVSDSGSAWTRRR